MCKFPEIPVGGRLKFFVHEWEKITQDQWILSVLREGLKLEFTTKPPFSGVRQTNVNAQNAAILQLEVEKLLQKGAIEPVTPAEMGTGFYSTFFVVPKKTGDLRPIINLKPLNRYLRKQHFKMDCLSKVINLVQQGDWAISIDLADAYLHIPIHVRFRKYLRFCIQGKAYQFTCLCFGPTLAPRTFTKVVSVIAAHLRLQNVRLAVYLDDWFIINQLRKLLLLDKEKTLNLLVRLGLMIRLEKSALVPSQRVIYIGAVFLMDKGIVCPTLERIQKIEKAIFLIIQEPTAHNFLHLLGLMASCIELIPNARLFMRPIQLHLLHFWRPVTRELQAKIPITQHLLDHLEWWKNKKNLLKGKPFCPEASSKILTTDASKHGYGGHLENHICQGTWFKDEQKLHINHLELKAVHLSLQKFLPHLRGQSVLVRSDNTTVVQYLNRQGGTKSPPLCLLTWNLLQLAIKNNITIKAAHIIGSLNILADDLSRVKIRPTEWTLNNSVTLRLFQVLGTPMIDLFASEANHKVEMFCSWIPSPYAWAIDALSVPWQNMDAYAFPPISLIPKVLQHMKKFRCQLILIAPQWPRRHWYTDLLQMLVAPPMRLPMIEDLLYQPRTKIVHPNPQVFNLAAWPLSTDLSKIKAFHQKLENSWQPHGELVHRKTIQQNSENSVAGVVRGRLIRIQPL